MRFAAGMIKKYKIALGVAGLVMSSQASAAQYDVVFDITFNGLYSYDIKAQVAGFIPFSAQIEAIIDDTLISSTYQTSSHSVSLTNNYNPATLISPVTQLLPWNGANPPTSFSSSTLSLYDSYAITPPWSSGGNVGIQQEASTSSGVYDAQLDVRGYDFGADLHTHLEHSLLTNDTVYFNEQLVVWQYGVPISGKWYTGSGHIASINAYTAPVPEPRTNAMFLVGLGVIGLAAYGRKMFRS